MCQPRGVTTPLRIGMPARLLSEPEGYFFATAKHRLWSICNILKKDDKAVEL
jgi:hypothetical protein